MTPHSEHSPDGSASDGTMTIDVPVLIVGGGPTGLLEAHMLSKLGGLKSSGLDSDLNSELYGFL
jgi:ribulose 1,5-bisphosphate synthetase/thiazole synthase